MSSGLAGQLGFYPVDVQRGRGTRVRRENLLRLVDLDFLSLPALSSVGADLLVSVQDGTGEVYAVTAGQLLAASFIGKAGVGRTTVSDANYSIVASDYYVGFTELTAPRAVRLPWASLYAPGQALYIVDESGNCGLDAPITISVAPKPSQTAPDDTIAGASSVTMASAYQKLVFHSNGQNLWTVA